MLAIIPDPTHIQTSDANPFRLSASTRILVPTADLAPLTTLFSSQLHRLAGMTVDVIEGEIADESPVIRLELAADTPDMLALPETGGTRTDGGDPNVERYSLAIREDGIRIRAAHPEGVYRGLTTLLQLSATTSQELDGTVSLPAVEIADAPRFAWRGLSFDVARTFFQVEEVKRVIDLLTLYKANVLHLHLTDSEGWRIEIDAWPLLTQIGGQSAAGNRPGGFYTKDDYREIVRYAAARFITIVPEFDMPGHTAAIYRACPELAGDGVDAATADLERAAWFQVMHPDHPHIFSFVTDVLTEISELTPGAYLHIGGDEALGMDGDLYRRFVEQVMPIVKGLGKKVVGWQETARAGVATGDIAQLWISPKLGDLAGDVANIDPNDLPEGFELPPFDDALIAAFTDMLKLAAGDLDKALEQGANILVSQSTSAYLDTKYSEPPSDPTQEADWARLGMPFYPKSTVAEYFAWDPATIRPGLHEDRIVGVEAGIWCETIQTFDDLLFMLLPRLPGLFEKGWSPAVPDADAWAGYAPRLVAQTPIWDRHGWVYFRSSVVWPREP
ncbi:MAG: beta-N-acetylhexosaminidase [Thermomicrobiales bacterium]